MALALEDRLAITELIALHGHLVDEGELDRCQEVFTPDVVYDLSDVAQGPVTGLAALKQAALALGAANPVAHHVTNVVIEEVADGRVLARSKGLGVMADGSCGSVTYEDTVVRVEAGWRICHRKVSARRAPLGGLGQERRGNGGS
ncbi:nuclear transport factor 2 family protein [Streptomyces sp. S.PNR 29]|uniref:nuclear transport factor 2 family protein n=1 Tax=Streptomyces sp. S.PNR 29 TaxID=2973805 RepID=UPI0025AFB2EA|nr:nuclear transport factor 2 family protein [Streptomyces sp. S.PNR 29]MDN0199051.1 nuclear transport factor 2 family protein [Streptomyces sp. S.PNR 29]